MFSILHYLRDYDFSHGNPNTKNIKFTKEVVSYIYDGVHISSPVTLKLLDFSTSSCTIEKNLRLYSKNVVADEQLKNKTFTPILDTVNDEVMVYKLKDPKKYPKAIVLYNYMKHLGLPIYSSSFDAYAFMIVLMSDKSFYVTFQKYDKLKNFWKNMWVNKEDFKKINERLENIHDEKISISYEDVLTLLNGLSLRCDMIENGWNLIKTL